MKLIKMLEGKKTIIGILVGAIYSVLISLNIVPSNDIVWTIIIGWTGVSYRLAIK